MLIIRTFFIHKWDILQILCIYALTKKKKGSKYLKTSVADSWNKSANKLLMNIFYNVLSYILMDYVDRYLLFLLIKCGSHILLAWIHRLIIFMLHKSVSCCSNICCISPLQGMLSNKKYLEYFIKCRSKIYVLCIGQ